MCLRTRLGLVVLFCRDLGENSPRGSRRGLGLAPRCQSYMGVPLLPTSSRLRDVCLFDANSMNRMLRT